MRPPLLLHAFSTFAVGGPQMRFATIANRLGARFRHAVVAMDGNLAARARLDPGLDVVFPDVAIRKGETWGNARRFRGALQTIAPDRLITHNWGTIEWSIANRLQVVKQVHVEDGFGPEERTQQISRRVWMRRVFLGGRQIVVPSLTLQRIATEIWRLPVTYVPNGIDVARFDAAPVPHGGVVVGTVAALRPEKNLARLVRAVALVEGLELVVIGDGPERPALEALAQSLGMAGRVTWVGHVSDPAPLLRGMDLFAMSSDTEQMPISLLEAMAAGLPVAATDVGDIAAMVPPEQRELVTALDDAALAGALRRLAGDGALRTRLGAANRARVREAYGEERMVAAWAGLWGG